MMRARIWPRIGIALGTACGSLLCAVPASGAEGSALDTITKALSGSDPAGAASSLRAFALLTVLSVVPSIVLLGTSFPRILVVLSFLRRALGAQDLPSNQILAGLTLILTALVMAPVWKRVHEEAYLPLTRGELKTTEEALLKAAVPLKEFMLSHTLERDLRLFVELSEASRGPANGGVSSPRPPTPDTLAETHASDAQSGKVEDLGFFVVFPAFVLSELKLAFQMGFLIFLPFLVIDLAVSAVLVSMGMFLMPPSMVSIPLKILVFVLADGWNLVVAQLVQGFQTLS